MKSSDRSRRGAAAAFKHVARALTPPAIYEAAHWAKEKLLGAPEAEWVRIERWPNEAQAWEAYTVGSDDPVQVCLRQDQIAARHGFTALSERTVDRAFLLASAYTVARAAQRRDRLSVLDFGGSLGHGSIVARQAAPEITIDYTVQELPQICEAGRRARPSVTFAANNAELAPRYDLVVASGALQYVEDWRGQLARLAARSHPWLFLNRLPLLQSSSTMIARQRIPQGHVVSWCWNEDELLAAIQALGLATVLRFQFQETFVSIEGADELPKIRGLLLKNPD